MHHYYIINSGKAVTSLEGYLLLFTSFDLAERFCKGMNFKDYTIHKTLTEIKKHLADHLIFIKNLLERRSIKMTAAKLFLIFMNELKEAISAGNKSLILFCYDMINSLDFDQVPDDLLKEYDKLISKANNILFTNPKEQ